MTRFLLVTEQQEEVLFPEHAQSTRLVSPPDSRRSLQEGRQEVVIVLLTGKIPVIRNSVRICEKRN